jgi:hypothetical protein
MTELLTASLRFPTVVFTIALGIALVYWLFVLLGALDLDLLGGGHGDMDIGGGHDIGGGGHDIGGGHDAGGDATGDGSDASDGGGGLGGLWHTLGLGTVPLTISISIIVLVGWCGTLLATTYIAGDSLPLRSLIFPIVLLLTFPIAALLVKPLAPIFKIKEGKTNADYIGHVCTITTNSVDTTFGFATIEDGGSHVQISVRCDHPTGLVRGDKALVIDFDAARRTFLVEPASDLVPQPQKETL